MCSNGIGGGSVGNGSSESSICQILHTKRKMATFKRECKIYDGKATKDYLIQLINVCTRYITKTLGNSVRVCVRACDALVSMHLFSLSMFVHLCVCVFVVALTVVVHFSFCFFFFFCFLCFTFYIFFFQFILLSLPRSFNYYFC